MQPKQAQTKHRAKTDGNSQNKNKQNTPCQNWRQNKKDRGEMPGNKSISDFISKPLVTFSSICYNPHAFIFKASCFSGVNRDLYAPQPVLGVLSRSPCPLQDLLCAPPPRPSCPTDATEPVLSLVPSSDPDNKFFHFIREIHKTKGINLSRQQRADF